MTKIFGLDLGIASVGSAVVEMDDASNKGAILFAGARVFPAAEDPKTGDSLALPRRLARSMRRRIHRRRFRLDQLWQLLAKEGMSDAALGPEAFQTALRQKVDEFCAAGVAPEDAAKRIDPYALRVKGLDGQLAPWEWVRALMHIAARRGFKSNSKAQENDAKSDTGKMNTAIRDTEALFSAANARTVGEYIFSAPPFADHRRNKGGSYKLTLKRDWLRDELEVLFSKQRASGNPHASTALETAFIQRFYHQRHYDQGNIDEMIGICEFEEGEQRAAKGTWAFQHAMALQKINHLRWSISGQALQPLTGEHRKIALDLALTKPKITFAELRTKCDLPSEARFNGVTYQPKKNKKGEISEEDPVKAGEAAIFIELKSFHSLRKLIVDTHGEISWGNLSGNKGHLDAIGSALSKFKADDKRLEFMLAANVDEKIAATTLQLTGDAGFGSLSLKALHKIIPHLEAGLRYDEAMAKEYGDHRKRQGAEKQKLLPAIPTDEVRNPVVLRALSQARKVLNALIREYGSPNRIHIELGREVGKSRDERNEIKDGQEAFRAEKLKAAEQFRQTFPDYGEPKNEDVLKFRLWREQDRFCVYSGTPIRAEDLLNPGFCEIDHILPRSRSQDDGQHNKALCTTASNRTKRNQTPYEWLNGAADTDKWREFKLRVTSNPKFRKPKRDRLLREEFSDATAEGFKERNLNDTRYITRYFKDFVEAHLQIDVIETDKQPVMTSSGKLTSFLRAQWGLIKVRGESDTHHALDAIVVACATKGIEHRLTRYHKALEIYADSPREAAELVNLETGEITHSHYKDLRRKFPTPWEGFRDDVAEAMKAVFVSRPPRRKWSGPLHNATVYGFVRRSAQPEAKFKEIPGKIRKRIPIEKVTLANLETAIEKDRNQKLYDAVRSYVSECGNWNVMVTSAKKAKDKNELERLKGTCPATPSLNCRPIRAITVEEALGDGVRVRGGIAANAEIVRVDVYRDAKGKNYFVPIYISDFGKQTPCRAITRNKPRQEWLLMDDSYQYVFALYKHEPLEIGELGVVFFDSIHPTTAGLEVSTHDRSLLKEGVGAKNLKVFHKLSVDVLGRISYVKKEPRLALAKHTSKPAE